MANILASPYDQAKIVDYADGDYTVEPTGFVGSYVTNSTYTVKEGETLQMIANTIYGDSGLWYIIADANDIMNPFDEKEFYAGMLLNIP